MNFSLLVNTSLGGLHIYLALFSAALLGLIGKADSPLIMFTPVFWSVWHLLIEFFGFTRFIVHQLRYLLSLASQPCPIWTVSWGIWCWGSFWGFNISNVFGGGSKMVWWNLRSFPRYIACLVHQSSWWSPLLSPGWFAPSTVMSLWWSCWILIPCFHWSKGIQNYQMDCSAPGRNVLGGLLTEFLFCLSDMMKVLMRYIPWSLMRFLLQTYFLVFCEKERIK